MDRLLIVDDEDIEREGIANLIDWEQHGIKMVGTAWNGIDGLKQMEQLRPNIVLVDIKMPGMNGLEMIHQARPLYPDTVFIILSGYGEYEFTSQAMEEGIRHYILKPCDEEKITTVIKRVQAELAEQQAKAAKADQARALLPRAQEQIFRDLLLGRVQPDTGGTRQMIAELGGLQREIMTVAFRLDRGFDYTEQFIIGNIMSDLLPEGTLLLSTEIRTDLFLLLDPSASGDLGDAVSRLRKEFLAFETKPLRISASRTGTLSELPRLYEQTTELLYLADMEEMDDLLRYGQDQNGQSAHLMDYQAIRDASTYEEILFNLHLATLKLRLAGRDREEIRRYFAIVWRMLAGEAPTPELSLNGLADALAAQKGLVWKDDGKNQKILLTTYQYINDPGINLQTLAREKLFMNEEHLGRLFLKLTGMRFSAFIEDRRMRQAKQLLRFRPDMKISQLAELVGYPADGQYFSKSFRKIYGVTPSEYRDSL